MAKSKSFFGLRTGSTKSLTFQVYRGQQITKDRVYRVSNPRTAAQMTQRALIPIVAAARSALSGLVDHSFEGVQYGEASLKEFSKQNLRAGALSVTSYSPNGVSNPGFANLVVSNGSIDGKFTSSPSKSGCVYTSIDEYPDFKLPAAKANDPATAIFSYLETYARTNDVPIFKPGTQLTFLNVYEAGTVNVKSVAGTKEASLSSFDIVRFMIPDSETGSTQIQDVNGVWKVKSDIRDSSTLAVIVNTNGDEITFECSGEGTGGNINIYVKPKVSAPEANRGGALILSRYENGTWRRNSATINIKLQPEHTYTFEDWLGVYQTKGTASKKYLNNGDESTGING